VTLRLGFVGGGFMTAFHLRALRQVRGADVVGLCSRTRPDALAKYVADNDLGPGRVFESVREMAAHVDAVAICAPNFARIECLEELVQAVRDGAGLRAVLCEKPLARNLAEARRMVELIESVGLAGIYLENQLHMNSVTAVRAQLEPVARAMGAPVLARAAEEHSGPHAGWFWDPVQQGGGVLSDMGCHAIALGWFALTPPGEGVRFLRPVSVQADTSLLKWGEGRWRDELLDRFGVDYDATPAEDFATGLVTYHNPRTDALVKGQFTVSWMYDKQGLRLTLDGIGPGYAFEQNSLRTGVEVFVGDGAAKSVADAELALEKSTASRGLLAVEPNEPDLYGYTDQWVDALAALRGDRPPLLDFAYGVEIVRVCMAAYLSAERGSTVDLTDEATLSELETYVPLIQQGAGRSVLMPGRRDG